MHLWIEDRNMWDEEKLYERYKEYLKNKENADKEEQTLKECILDADDKFYHNEIKIICDLILMVFMFFSTPTNICSYKDLYNKYTGGLGTYYEREISRKRKAVLMFVLWNYPHTTMALGIVIWLLL